MYRDKYIFTIKHNFSFSSTFFLLLLIQTTKKSIHFLFSSTSFLIQKRGKCPRKELLAGVKCKFYNSLNVSL